MKSTIKIFAIPLMVLFFLNMTTAQGDDTIPEKTGEASSEKISASMNLSYKISDGKKSIKAEVSYKEDGNFIPVENLIINLYLTEVKKYDPTTGDGWMGNVVTNELGVGVFTFTKEFYALTKGIHTFNFIVNSGSDPRYEDLQEEIIMNEPLIELSFDTQDSITTALARLSAVQEGEEVPLPETELKLLIKRTLGMLPFGEEGLTTDENGEVTAELPADVPGNANGTITVVARFDDEENNGVIEVSKNIPWKVIPKSSVLNQRFLWSSRSNAPVILIVTSIAIITTIWGILFYLVFLVFKIKKLGKPVGM